MDELKDKSNIEIDISSWVEVPDSLPLQQNGYVFHLTHSTTNIQLIM
jgi:hypothetical protein